MSRLGLLLVLGVRAFAQQPIPVTESANLPQRPIQSGDLLAVTVYGAPELSRMARVTDGTIRLPMLSESIKVLGLMPLDVEDRVAARLEAEMVLVSPAVTVTIAEYRNRPISVIGAVRQPLTFSADHPVTLIEALARAEGLAPDAGGEALITHRGSNPGDPPHVDNVSLKALMDGSEADSVLEGGEEVRIPAAGRIFVVGNVRKPGGFPAIDGTGMTVLKAVALAEGLAPFAKKQAYVYRHQEDAPGAPPQEIVVELRKIMDRAAPDVTLGANDILYIPDSRAARTSANVIEKAIAFIAGTASGALILSVNH